MAKGKFFFEPVERLDVDGQESLVLGDKVKHAQFGRGVVVRIGYGNNEQPLVRIDFRKHGVRELDSRYANLKRVWW